MRVKGGGCGVGIRQWDVACKYANHSRLKGGGYSG